MNIKQNLFMLLTTMQNLANITIVIVPRINLLRSSRNIIYIFLSSNFHNPIVAVWKTFEVRTEFSFIPRLCHILYYLVVLSSLPQHVDLECDDRVEVVTGYGLSFKRLGRCPLKGIMLVWLNLWQVTVQGSSLDGGCFPRLGKTLQHLSPCISIFSGR